MTTQIHVHETAVDSARPRRRPFGPAAAVLAGLAAIGMSLWSALNNDVTYALGGLETAGAGGVSVWDVFVARPVAYRLIIALLDLPVPGGAPLTTAHEIVRLGAYVLVAGVAFVLYLGLRRFVTEPAAAVTAVATGLTLIVAPQWHFLEPDWVAGLVAVLAVGAACAPRQVWLGAVLGGFAAFLAVAVKLATFPLALLALLLVALVSRRRAAWAAAATVGFTVIWYLATRTFLPWEWTWLNDQAHLIVNAPVHQGIRWHDIERMLIAIGEVAVLSPIVAVAPAAAAVLVRRLDPGRPRWIGAGIAVLAAGMSVASAYGQGEFFMYHFAAVPVFAAGVVGAAFGLSPGARTPLVMTTGLAAVASFFLLRQAPEWRHDNVTFVAVGYAVIAVTGAVVAGRPARWRAPATLGAVVLSAALVLATLPNAPLAFSGYNYALGNERAQGHGYAALRERIGADTPVLYLSFGAINYLLGNPTTCRYPSPQWLQRATYVSAVKAFPSYVDNVRCLTDDQQARYLVWQPSWFKLARSSPEVRGILDQRFDCSPEARVPAPTGIVVCPARP